MQVESEMNAIEANGIVDAQHQLRLDKPLPLPEQSRVRVIVLLSELEINDAEWLKSAAANPAFDFLKDEAEEIYTQADGKPFHD